MSVLVDQWPHRVSTDPDSDLDYTLDWADWLSEVSDTISTSAWIVDSGLVGHNESNTTTTTTTWLKEGTKCNTYKATNRIETVGGRTEDRTLIISVIDK